MPMVDVLSKNARATDVPAPFWSKNVIRRRRRELVYTWNANLTEL